MSSDPGDSWYWSIDELVNALCSSPSGLLLNGGLELRFDYDLKSLEQSLRSNEVNGNIFLNAIDENTLRNDLGVKTIGQRYAILKIQKLLRERSTKYRRSINQEIVDSPFGISDDRLRQSIHNLFSRDITDHTQDLQANKSHTPIPPHSIGNLLGSAGGEQQGPEQQGPEQQRITVTTVQETTATAIASTKKPQKRLVLTSAHDAAEAAAAATSGYYGLQPLSVDSLFFGKTSQGQVIDLGVKIKGKEGQVVDELQAQNPETYISFVGNSGGLPGLARFVNKRMKYYLSQHCILSEDDGSGNPGLAPYPAKLAMDVVPSMTCLTDIEASLEAVRTGMTGYKIQSARSKANQAGAEAESFLAHLATAWKSKADDKLLKVYGESDPEDEEETRDDNEYNSTSSDEELNGKEAELLRHLTNEEMDQIINEAISEQSAAWEKKKLPQLEFNAFKYWYTARKGASSSREIERLRYMLDHLQSRLSQLKTEIKLEEYTKQQRSKVKMQCQSLEVTIFESCTAQWKIKNLGRTAAPKRIEKPVFARKHESHRPPDLDSDEEDLVDLSDRDDNLEDFIVDDDVIAPHSLMRPADNALKDLSSETETLNSTNSQRGAASEDDEVLNVEFLEDEVTESDEDHDASDTVNDPTLAPSSGSVQPKKESFDNAPQQSFFKSTSNIVDLTLSDEDSSAPASQPHSHNILQQTNLGEVDHTQSFSTIEESSTQTAKPLWKEPPKAPSPRSPLETAYNKRTTSRSQKTSTNPSTPRHTPKRTRFNSPQIFDSEPSNDENSFDPDDNDDGYSTLPDYNDIEALKRKPADLVTERGDRRRSVAWMVANSENAYDLAAGYCKGRSATEMQPDIWDALHSIKSNGSKIRGNEKNSQALRMIAGWFVGWVRGIIIDPERGFKISDVVTSLESTEEFQEFYEFLHLILLKQKEELYNRNRKRPLLLKAHLLKAQDNALDSDEDPQRSTSKKRKHPVTQSQEAKRLRLSAFDRQKKHEAVRERLMRTKFGSAGSSNSLQVSPVVNLSKSEDQDEILLHEHIARRVFPYQLGGIQFMWKEIITANEMQGCLLAQPMGMGKTLQVIALLVTIAEASRSKNLSIKRQIPERFWLLHFLVLCPATLVENWRDEFLLWAPKPRSGNIGEIYIVDASIKKDNRPHEIAEWARTGGILLMALTTFRDLVLNSTRGNRPPYTEDVHNTICEHLLQLPSIVVCDEAQAVKGFGSQLNTTVNKIQTNSRIALTGSPLSNNLEEYYRILDWVAPGYLGNPVEFRARFIEPISAGLYIDASEYEKRRSLKMLSILKRDITPKIHRDELSALRDKLPGKTEFVIRVPLTRVQQECYKIYVESILKGANDATPENRARIWAYVAVLRLLCSHPYCFERKLAHTQEPSEGQDKTVEDLNQAEGSTDPVENESQELTNKPDQLLEKSMIENQLNYLKMVPRSTQMKLTDKRHSHKMELVHLILTLAKSNKEQTLVFSHFLSTLNYVQRMIAEESYGSVIRFDGSTPMSRRQNITKDFNAGRYDIALVSTRAGGTGLNLYGASRVIILDETWNPMFEQQAIGRAYRIGQKKHVYVYRIIMGGTFEESMQNQSLFKIGLSSRVVDKKDTVRNARKGLKEWIFHPREQDQGDLSHSEGKDPLILDEIMKKCNCIRSIQLADTFLAEEAEELTEEEQRDVAREEELLRLRRTDPVAYERKRAEFEQQQFARTVIQTIQPQALYSTPLIRSLLVQAPSEAKTIPTTARSEPSTSTAILYRSNDVVEPIIAAGFQRSQLSVDSRGDKYHISESFMPTERRPMTVPDAPRANLTAEADVRQQSKPRMQNSPSTPIVIAEDNEDEAALPQSREIVPPDIRSLAVDKLIDSINKFLEDTELIDADNETVSGIAERLETSIYESTNTNACYNTKIKETAGSWTEEVLARYVTEQFRQKSKLTMKGALNSSTANPGSTAAKLHAQRPPASADPRETDAPEKEFSHDQCHQQ